MKTYKRLLSLALILVLSLSLRIPAFAAAEDLGFSDVAADAWYAEAAAYVREKGIMNGTSATAFSDVPDTACYAQAVRLVNANGIITEYGDSTFHTDNPVTREQITTILWRCAGSPRQEPPPSAMGLRFPPMRFPP